MISMIWQTVWGRIARHPLIGITGIFVAGAMAWGAFNWSMELTNTENFCISCHAMEATPYAEYKKSVHYSNRTGVRASCPDCHVPRDWIHKVQRKIRATNELFHWAIGTVSTPEKFEAKRPILAAQVWQSMSSTDSRECRNCHDMEFMTEESQTKRARLMHSLATSWGKTCIDCHKGIAHNLPKGFDSDAIMDELHDRMEAEKIDCAQCHEGMAGAKDDDGW